MFMDDVIYQCFPIGMLIFFRYLQIYCLYKILDCAIDYIVVNI